MVGIGVLQRSCMAFREILYVRDAIHSQSCNACFACVEMFASFDGYFRVVSNDCGDLRRRNLVLSMLALFQESV